MNIGKTSVAIIGAGASGTILANQIIEKACNESDVGITVFLIEKGPDFGPGLAYSSPLSSHILNMRADTLGIEKNNPLHFLEWLRDQGDASFNDANCEKYDINYPPRNIYGRYLKYILESTMKKTASSPCSLDLIRGEVVDIEHNGSFIQVKMADGNLISVDNVVLAPGNFPSSFLNELKGIKGYIPYPWPVKAIKENIPNDNPVCILGTGLSAIDTFFTLQACGHRGENYIYFKARIFTEGTGRIL